MGGVKSLKGLAEMKVEGFDHTSLLPYERHSIP